ncbi:MAG TPA: DUF5666 domain-containing protein, partial [Nitrospiria bacterium]|nr:DUF5666 domain-containing protein [Nitrospiria bacterium]
DFVEAAGFQTAGGTLLATRIGRVPEPLIPDESLVSIRGTIDRNLPLSQQFVISGLTIKYDHPDLVLENINLESLAEGIPVWVRGTITAGGVLTAKRIEAGEGLPLSAAPGPGELEGLITAMVSETAFEFEGIPVSFGPDTLFTNGTVKDLALNARLEVEGRKNANGTLSAERVTFTDERMEIEADVESVDLENQTVQLLGLRFDITPLTTFQDDSAARRVPFGFENIIPGNHVRIQGILKDGRFTAGTLTRMLPDSGIVIRGPVDGIQRSFINTMGILVRMGTDTVFLDENNNPVSSEGFLTITRPGDRIAVRGTEGGSLLIDAVEVELER